MGDQLCKLKVILDSQNLSGLSEGLCVAARYVDAALLTDDNAYPIIEQLNKAEGCVIEAQKLFMKAVGYDGPLPKFLQDKAVGGSNY